MQRGTRAEDNARHDRMVELVEQMLSLHQRWPLARTGDDETIVRRQMDVTDRQIDRLVVELYGFSEDETALVEGVAAK